MNSSSVNDNKERAHRLIPGGCHTYAKGDDQYPANAPAFIVKGEGCHIWDDEGHEYIEFAMGLRAVTLGHAYPSVNAAAIKAMQCGNNFNRPTLLEGECAEMFCSMLPNMEMVKFTKDGSSALTAAVKLARAYTGRKTVAMCSGSPFFSYDDWFIGKTSMNSGIPEGHYATSVTFNYNDIDSLQRLFDENPNDIACVLLEPCRIELPEADFLKKVQDLCQRNGAIFILDEMITGFRWHNHGAQHLFDIEPDLACFGKAMANGFAVSALAGKRELMELGGIRQTNADRVFLLSTTHGAESTGLAAAIETMRVYRDEPVVEHLSRAGKRLRNGADKACEAAGVSQHIQFIGQDCNLFFTSTDSEGQPSQPLRTLFLQELLKGGILSPSFLTSYSHSDADIDKTIHVIHEAASVYASALTQGVDKFLVGPASASVFRRRNPAS